MADEVTAPVATEGRVRHEMLDEGRRLVDAARAEGLTLRLLGGLAVREHCRSRQLCERDYTDLDMVAPARDSRRLTAIFREFGYTENLDVSTATANAEIQFVRSCAHDGESGAHDGEPRAHGGESGARRVHPDDHVDVFLDTFRMDHDIALLRRLEIEPYTVSLSDLLLTKLQIFRMTEKDLRDIITLLADVDVGDRDGPGLISGRYVGELCADDWGLFYDVTMNLQRVGESVAMFDLDDAQTARVNQAVLRLVAAIDGAPKSLRWRLRARVGTRKSWHSQLDDQE